MIDTVQSQADPTTVNIERKVESLVQVSRNPDRSSEMLKLSRGLKHWWRSSLFCHLILVTMKTGLHWYQKINLPNSVSDTRIGRSRMVLNLGHKQDDPSWSSPNLPSGSAPFLSYAWGHCQNET
jgi:hypothetical protein